MPLDNPTATVPQNTLVKTVTFTGAAGAGATGSVLVATITGLVEILKLIPVCTADLIGATATISLGVVGAVTQFVGVTTATTIDNGQYWLSTTPGILGLAVPSALKEIIIAANIVMDVLVQAVTGGSLRFDITWRPVSAGASLV